MSNITDRIRKLLALGGNNPNEHEAARAMELASELMMKHGITEDQLGVKVKVGYSNQFESDDLWQTVLAHSAGVLYGTKPVFWKRTGKVAFAGRQDNTDASSHTYAFLIEQVEALYKQALPSGLSKTERSEFRRHFKKACSGRIWARANQSIAKVTSSGNALVVVDHRKQLQAEAEEFMAADGVKKSNRTTSLAVRPTAGALAGRAAGDRAQLHRTVR
jgi:hypothetical protein